MSEARVERRRVPRYPATVLVEMEQGNGVTRDIGASVVVVTLQKANQAALTAIATPNPVMQ